ncbi:hypothetical protein MRB53_038048 [Persea americana]|nr:hypothetical protein MRB53_038048 [Persea americana]
MRGCCGGRLLPPRWMRVEDQLRRHSNQMPLVWHYRQHSTPPHSTPPHSTPPHHTTPSRVLDEAALRVSGACDAYGTPQDMSPTTSPARRPLISPQSRAARHDGRTQRCTAANTSGRVAFSFVRDTHTAAGARMSCRSFAPTDLAIPSAHVTAIGQNVSRQGKARRKATMPAGSRCHDQATPPDPAVPPHVLSSFAPTGQSLTGVWGCDGADVWVGR